MQNAEVTTIRTSRKQTELGKHIMKSHHGTAQCVLWTPKKPEQSCIGAINDTKTSKIVLYSTRLAYERTVRSYFLREGDFAGLKSQIRVKN